MSETDNIIIETATRIFTDLADPQTINKAKDASWEKALWTQLEENGLTRAWVPETSGGAGVSLADGFEVIRTSGRFACSVPLAETLVAGWLLSEAGMQVPEGTLTVAPTRWTDKLEMDGGLLSGRARNVPFGRTAVHIAVLAASKDDPVVALMRIADATAGQGATLAGDPNGEIVFSKAKPVATAKAPKGLDLQQLMLIGAAARANQMAGGLEAILSISTQYANERVAFEKKISKFQAVQHNLARLAGETAAALAAAGSAADAIATGATGDALFLEAASAKIRVAEAVQEGAGIAHQVHGAIGFTKEHILHRYTLRLWSWRDDFGNESDWAVRLGKLIANRGPDDLWPLVASR